MNRVVPPLCLLLALLLLIAGFAIVAIEKPQPSVALHRATAEGHEDYRDVLKAELDRERRKRNILIGSVFGMAILMAVTAFVAIRPR